MHIPTPERIPLPVPPPGLYSPPEEKRPQESQGAPGDGDLLDRIAQGDLDSFQTFYGRYAGRVLAYARQLGRNRDGVEDVVQEVFVAVWRRAASYRPDRGDPAGWLYTITRNKLVDHWRRLGGAGEPGDFDDLPFPAWEDGGDLRLAMRQALAQVAPEQRRAIEMAYFGGLTYEETAQRLDLPVGTLKSRIRSGLKRLRTLLEGS
ncbi:MAG TPA: RNA polymerase sigma factor [Thermoanaerobaculia bacterium]